QAVKKEQFHSPKASLLVNGYHPIHKEFEEVLAQANGFEKGLVVGSGFLANLSLIEALIRKKDILFMDEEYHASGMLATKLIAGEVVLFKHNDVDDLKQKLKSFPKHMRKIIAIEGVYSMSGDLASKEFYWLANEYNALLIVDEAHSSGVIGKNLCGWFDHFDLPILSNHIKMGTLGKAYGSYGAYILASYHIIEFLENRAKAIIYTTAPSLFDIALGLESFKYIQENKVYIKQRIKENLAIIKEVFDLDAHSLIVPIVVDDNTKVIDIQNELIQNGYLLGAIRQPTVKKAIIRLIAKIDIEVLQLKKVALQIKEKL
ncbi:MAG: pyridoxal phosphate-dependent aminotransferase family protein, partial [Campylobacterota bacterium]|nr:pyridoxal phosphate-dependent aminotransferase family protein [Campylobacterota bacterium]